MAICLLCFIHPSLDAREHEVSSTSAWETSWKLSWTWLLDLTSDLSDDLQLLLPADRSDVPYAVHVDGRSSDPGESGDPTATEPPPDDPAELKGTIISSG